MFHPIMRYFKILFGIFIGIMLTNMLWYHTATTISNPNNQEIQNDDVSKQKDMMASAIYKTTSQNIGSSIDVMKQKDIEIPKQKKNDIEEDSIMHKQSNMVDVDPMFQQLKTFILFIGYSRSGSSLTGTILDAHKHVVVSHEINILRKLKERLEKKKLSRNDFFEQIYRISSRQSQNYRAKHGHFGIWNYHIPNTYLGTYKDYIQVIGDKEAEQTTRIMSQNFKNFELFQEIIKLPIKFIHVIRNPYDIIATEALRHKGLRRKKNDLAEDAEPIKIYLPFAEFETIVKWNKQLRQKFGDKVLDVNYSYLLKEPRESLFRICKFLNIECDEDYIKACSEKLHPEESYTRRYVVWSDRAKSEVDRIIRNTDFLQGFTFEK